MENREIELARQFVDETDCNLFLTGKAGTGKTTFLHTLQRECAKRMVVTAPTGVAAINAGGVTLHSFFQRPFGPWIPGQVEERHNLRREKVALLRNLDLVVIDEISMVRADLLDSIDQLLRRYRHDERAFGGVQMLMIGDLYQLPPVVRDEEWSLLGQHYQTPWFFSSRALQRQPLVTIELTTVYRQRDPVFIDLLNQIRESAVTPENFDRLNSCLAADTDRAADDGTITLCTHNRQADAINHKRLQALAGSARSFTARVEGEFPESAWPTVERLTLKIGAQVMFIHNDPGPEKRFYNGLIGTVTAIDPESVTVSCAGLEDIEVSAISWDNVEYRLSDEMELEQEKIGSFTQIPLKTAWAITIHKSQGLTFDRVIIDAGAAFAPGQTYVALSRCRSFAGLTLRSPISSRAVQTDAEVRRFSEAARASPPDEEQLTAARIGFQQKLLLQCFDFDLLRLRFRRFLGTLRGNAAVVQLGGIAPVDEIDRQLEEVFRVSESFRRQLRGLFSSTSLPARDPAVIERFTRASAWFGSCLNERLMPLLDNIVFETDNKQVRTRLRRLFKELAEETAVKRAAVASCSERFVPGDYLRAIGAAAAEKQQAPAAGRSGAPLYREEDIANPEFFEELRRWRRQQAEREDVPAYRILAQKPLVQLAIHLPVSDKELLKIHGIGPKLAARYGAELLAMIRDYRLKNGITEISLPELTPEQLAERREQQPAPKHQISPAEKGRSTTDITLEYFRDGLDPEAIAEKRMLKRSTIDGHLADLIAAGQIEADEVMAAEVLSSLLPLIEPISDQPWSRIRERLGSSGHEVSYSEIKWLLAALKRSREKR